MGAVNRQSVGPPFKVPRWPAKGWNVVTDRSNCEPGPVKGSQLALQCHDLMIHVTNVACTIRHINFDLGSAG
jgi:hypothetical protein